MRSFFNPIPVGQFWPNKVWGTERGGGLTFSTLPPLPYNFAHIVKIGECDDSQKSNFSRHKIFENFRPPPLSLEYFRLLRGLKKTFLKKTLDIF